MGVFAASLELGDQAGAEGARDELGAAVDADQILEKVRRGRVALDAITT